MFLLTLASLLAGCDCINSRARVHIPMDTRLDPGSCAHVLKTWSFQVSSVLWATCDTTVNSVSLCCPAAPTRGYPSVENLSAMHFQAVFSTNVGGALSQ